MANEKAEISQSAAGMELIISYACYIAEHVRADFQKLKTLNPQEWAHRFLLYPEGRPY